MTVFDQFDAIRIINLPQRADRRRGMDRELARIGLQDDPRVQYFAAVRPIDAGSFTSVGARGCYESHKALIKEAAAAHESLLILEDDCQFYPDAVQQPTLAGWDIFYGGYTASNMDDPIGSDIQGSHMMGFSRDGVRLLDDYLNLLNHDGIHPPIDAAYVWFRRAFPDVPTAFAKPPMAGQRPSRSDIADLSWYDSVPVVRTLSTLLRGIRSKTN